MRFTFLVTACILRFAFLITGVFLPFTFCVFAFCVFGNRLYFAFYVWRFCVFYCRLYFAPLKKLFCRAFILPPAHNICFFVLLVSTWYTKNKRLLHCAKCVLRLRNGVRFFKMRFIVRFFAVLLAFLLYAKNTAHFVT